MDAANIISSISAGISLIALGVAWRSYSKSKQLTEDYNAMVARNNQFVAGQVEMQIRDQIRITADALDDIAREMQLADLDNPQTKELFLRRIKLKIENKLNAYDEACAKYIDNKVDKERFKKTYADDIQQLVRNEEYDQYFSGIKSKYKAILKVYDEWFNYEK